eukprot:398726_1
MKVYTKHAHSPRKALDLYDQTPPSIPKDDMAHLLAIKACEGIKDFEKGHSIACECIGDDNIYLLNALIHFYGTFNELDKAQDIFNNMKKDRVTICSMMWAYRNGGHFDKALALYDQYHEIYEDEDGVCHTLAMHAASTAEMDCESIEALFNAIPWHQLNANIVNVMT